MKAGDILPLLKDSYSEWSDDKASRLAAALSYYTAFSLAPLLVIAAAIAGFFFKQSDAKGQIVNQIGGLVGDQGAQIIKTMLENGSTQSGNIIATIIGIITLLVGATGVFVQLQDSLNTIWEVKLNPNLGIMGTIRQRVFSLAMVFAVGFLLLVSLIVSTAISGITGFITGGGDQSGIMAVVVWIINFVVAFGITTLLFAAIFKYVPDVEIKWSDVWAGAIFTALLFSIGRFVLGFYLGRGSFGSTYGAAASLVILLAWIYYSALIVFFGAEFTQVYARKYGSQLKPSSHAIPVTDDERANQGMTRDSGSQPRAGTQTPQRQPQARPHAPTMQEPPPSATSIGIAGFIAGVLAGRRSKARK
ncbi:MAG TPA: YihY/virulence factor BrkB family protein [Roseiflexaceae bacterium]|jgi:membrane protein|nr:YihY/virulence factor BrkB family protein [Roseiflexaceae bacterium]